MNALEQKLYTELKGIIEELGFQLLEVEERKEFGTRIISFVIDNSTSTLSIDDTVTVSEKVSEKLDEIDPIDTEYCIEVTSPGLERELKNSRDVKAAIGKYVNVKTYEKIPVKKNEYKEFEGDLLYADDEKIIINALIKQFKYEVEIPNRLIAKIRLAIKMN